MNQIRKDYRSTLGDAIRQFLEYKRALHKKYVGAETPLRALDAFLLSRNISSIEEIDTRVVEEFFVSLEPSKPSTFNSRLCVVRLLFEWMVIQGYLSSSPLKVKRRRETPYLVPFIFSTEDVNRLLIEADGLRDAPNTYQRAQTWRMMIMLGYGVGLRIGEIYRLTLGDIDFEHAVLLIANTKFGKTRLVPMGPKLAQGLKRFVLDANLVHKSEPVFSWRKDKRPQYCNTSVVFRELTGKANLHPRTGQREPRFHDLRHSFAVNSLLRLYQEGKDPSKYLLHLSTFLGHSSIEHTTVYLTITDELLNEASKRFRTFASSALQEVAQ